MQLDRPHGQMSDSFLMSAFIILSGGLQDAYTYCCRDKVFANAQTGNIVLMSTHLFAGDWAGVFRYFVPLISFMAGIFVAECVHRRYKCMEKVHWRQLIILAEIVLLFFVGFLPQEVNTFANALVSFVCAMQVQTFRKVNGYAFASTMCIGNLRSCVESLCAYGRTRDKHILQKAFSYLGIIILFAVGAALGGHFIPVIAARTIWISCGLLIVSFLFMFIREEVEEHPELLADEKAIKESFHNIKEETLDVTHILEDDIKSSRKDK